MIAPNTSFKNITSIPLLNESALTSQENQAEKMFLGQPEVKETIGSGIFKIGSLPPRSQTTVISSWNNITKDKTNGLNLTTYVRSDEAVGFHDTILTIIAYSLYIFILTFYSLILIRKPQRTEQQVTIDTKEGKYALGIIDVVSRFSLRSRLRLRFFLPLIYFISFTG